MGIRATFFITGDFLHDADKAQARLRPLVDAGHSLGVHTFSHRRATEMWERDGQAWLESDVLDQARMLGQLSRQTVHAFAYPFGDHDDVTDQVLMPHFHILRAFGKKVAFTTLRQLQTGGMIYATSIDNVHDHDNAWHLAHLADITRQSQFWVVASHHIDDSKWGITPQRLTQFAESAREMGIPFYRFEDFME
jgi:peptidoglycan/xylan/chitin deacetylase (PgdA/CDA1 family)